jgi:hypothetical protein
VGQSLCTWLYLTIRLRARDFYEPQSNESVVSQRSGSFQMRKGSILLHHHSVARDPMRLHNPVPEINANPFPLNGGLLKE